MWYTYVCLYVCNELSRKRLEDIAEVVLEDTVIKYYKLSKNFKSLTQVIDGKPQILGRKI